MKNMIIVGAIYIIAGLVSGLGWGFDWIDRFLICFGILLITIPVVAPKK